MPQVFPRAMNILSRASLFGSLLVAALVLWICLVYTRSPYGTAAGVMRALEGSDSGARLIAERIRPHQRAFGYKSIWSHELAFKTWVEDPAPIIEAVRGYLAADYDYPSNINSVRDDLERAKTALKYATMVLQRANDAESEGTIMNRRELSDGVDILTDALPSFRGRAMLKELEEGERLLYALQRTLIRTR